MKNLLPFLFASAALWITGCNTDSDNSPKGSISVTSTPAGAEVTVDGVPRGMTPVTVEDMPVGTHLVSLKKPGYRDAHKSVSLIDGQSAPVEILMEKTYGLLLVHSNPQGADISIDGKFRGQTPLMIPDIDLGRHDVSFSLPGYQPRESEVEMTDRTPRKLSIDLVTDSGTVALASTPAGATVLVGGQDAGRTPFTLERLVAGTHNLEFRLDGYKPITRSLVVKAGDSLDLAVDMIPIPGSLQIISIPADARLYLDNEFRGNTPLKIESLEPGSYRLRLEVEGFNPMARDVTVTRAGHSIEEFRLERNTGYFELVTEPAGVSVYVDGKLVGETEASISDVISNPWRLYTLEPGPHTLHLTKKGYSYQPKQFLVTREAPVTLHEKLKRLYIPDTYVRLKDAPNLPIECMIVSKEQNGDMEIMVSESATRKLKADQIHSVDPIRQNSP